MMKFKNFDLFRESRRNCVFQKWVSHQAGMGIKLLNGACPKAFTCSIFHRLSQYCVFSWLSDGGKIKYNEGKKITAPTTTCATVFRAPFCSKLCRRKYRC